MQETFHEMLDMFTDTGRIFSEGRGFSDIFEQLISRAIKITGAEGGSLYIYDGNSETLKIVVMNNIPLDIHKVVETFDALKISGIIEVPTRIDGELNIRTPSVCCFIENRKILIDKLDSSDEFDFTNTKKFDADNNYKTRNLIALPLNGHNKEVIGVLQLINCNDEVFYGSMQKFIDAITGQVGIMLSNALLVNKTEGLMSSIIQMIGVAIDEKSPHTAGHCQRVMALTMMITEALQEDDSPLYKDFSFNKDQWRELRIAALLHDIGKIITPIHILDKPTKLYALDDKINLLYERVRAWKIALELRQLKEKLKQEGLEHLIPSTPDDINKQCEDDYRFLEKINQGSYFIDDEAEQRLNEIASRVIEAPDENDEEEETTLIKEDELHNLKIPRGTLNPQERKIMEDHVSISIRLLSSIPWPSNLNKVVEYAGAHHENMNGTGYPNKLTGDQMELPARVLGLADRFEGLSAPDRPYRNVKMTLSRVMSIMENMAKQNEIDSDLFEFFKNRKLHLKYAEQYLPPDLIDC